MNHTFCAIVILLVSACTADLGPERTSASLRGDDGAPWEPEPPFPPGPWPGPGGWTPVDTRCYEPGCVYEYHRPPGSCTNATVFGPACDAALAAWSANNPGVPARCAGAVMGCVAPGERTPCTMSGCEMNIFIEMEGYGCNAERPCGEGFVCENGSCVPNCGDAGCQPGDCNPETGVCVPCDGPEDCEGDESCIDGRCVETCDPANPGTCTRGTCDPSTNECVECTESSCGEGQTCDPNSGRCRDTETCPHGSCAYGQCVDGVCRPCTPGSCPDGDTCDTDSGRCRDGCESNSECYGEQTCIGGICRTPCANDAACDRSEYCEGGYCRPAYAQNGQCPRPNMTRDGEWCYAPCTARTSPCLPSSVCDPVSGDCRMSCAGASETECPSFQQCWDGMCLSSCDPRILPCPAGTCTYDEAQNPYCDTTSCPPGDCRCGPPCMNGLTCDPATGFCTGGFDPCAGVYCPLGTCVGGVCQSSGGCTWDFDCSFGDECVNGVCVDGGTVNVCALDGACTAGETCACEPFCCVGGGGPGPGSGTGGTCGWDGGPTISYGDCAACGGTVVWTGDGYACAEMQMQ
jgi:hypothetical protein